MPVKYPYLLFLDGFLFCCFFSRLLLLLLDIPPSAEPLLVCTVKLRPSVRRWRFCAQHHRHHQDGEVEEGRRRRRRRGEREHQPAAASASGCGSNSHRSNNTHAPFFFSFSFFLSFFLFFFFTRAGTQKGRQSARSAAPKSPQLVWHKKKQKKLPDVLMWTYTATDSLTDCDKWSLPAAPQPRVLKVQ